MESVGVYLKEDWDYSLNKMFSGADEADCMLHWLQNFSTPSEISATYDGSAAMFDDDSLFYSSENPNPNSYLSQDVADSSISASNYTSVFFPNHFSNFNHMITPLTMDEMIPHESISHDDQHKHDNFVPLAGNLLSEENVNIGLCMKEEILENAELIIKRKFKELKQSESVDKDDTIIIASDQNPKKKCRVPRDTTKNKKNSPGKKNQQLVEMNKNDKDLQSVNMLIRSGSFSSEDDSNASQEPNGGSSSESKDSAALNSSGKARAGRGAATDPQSLYARKRRERINERLRILQHLVPNGTKVDISTMLEEAVQYVKFLQLQIKLLSSDNTWMYAPIAYNGMDMGLYQNISPAI